MFTVLCYHGVYPEEAQLNHLNSSGKHLSQSVFERQMRAIREKFEPVSMNQISESLNHGGDLPQNALAVTFDDGYLNNFSQAVPILDELKIPATFYVTTGFIGRDRLIWTDLLEAAVFSPLRSEIAFQVDGQHYFYALEDVNQRQETLKKIKMLCKAGKTADGPNVANQVCRPEDIDIDLKPAIYDFMNWDQIREIASCDLFSVGAHTVDHVSLGRADNITASWQIRTSIAEVGRQLGSGCIHFAYPEGQENDVNEYSKNEVKRSGVICAPTAISGQNCPVSTDPFYIKRIMVGFEGRKIPMLDRKE